MYSYFLQVMYTFSVTVTDILEAAKGEYSMADFYLLGNTTQSQMFGCVIQSGMYTIVIDGGTMQDDDQLMHFLRQKASSHVNAWFFTHPHHDHIGCFVNICKKTTRIMIDKIYCHFPDRKQIQEYARVEEGEKELINDFFRVCNRMKMHRLHTGDVFEFGDVTIRTLRVYNPMIQENFLNNSSSVFRIEGKHASVLILGDLGIAGGDDLMKNCPLSLLKTDYTQMAHHGQRGVSKEFYDYIKPKRCIWATPDWLWNNDAGKGHDTGPWQTIRTREWVLSMGVTEHIIEKDGIQRFTF